MRKFFAAGALAAVGFAFAAEGALAIDMSPELRKIVAAADKEWPAPDR